MSDVHEIGEAVAAAGAQWMAFGPPVVQGGEPIRVAAHFDAYAAEYAAMRQRVGVLHLPQRGCIRVAGGDAKAFLHRLLTRDIAGMKPGETRRSFQLNAKGRIVADMVVHHGEEQTWLEMDRFDVPGMMELLERRLFSEAVSLTDASDERVVIWLLGPAAVALLDAVRSGDVGGGASAATIGVDTHRKVEVAGVNVLAWRHAALGHGGPAGVRLHTAKEAAGVVYAAVLAAAGFEAGEEPDADSAARRRASLRGRPVGWLAFNTLRIESGLPLFHIDFGSDSLPAEAGEGVLHDRVDFAKGCYLGQEITLRMKNFGHPRRLAVGLRFPDLPPGPDAAMPVGGTQVFAPEPGGGVPATIVGGVSSATLAPLLGQSPIALAVVKWSHHAAGTELVVPVEGELTRAVVTPLEELVGG